MSDKFKSYRDESRINWGQTLCDKQHPERADLEFGCLLRIADAAELMAKNHQQLINERDMYERWNNQKNATIERLRKRIAGLQGYITRLKKSRRR